MKNISFNWDKKGISVMIGYILLVVGAVIMGALIYQWMKSYVPKDTLECAEGVSLQIKDNSCIVIDGNYELNLKLVNNGRFSIGGYFIHATNETYSGLAVIDLTEFITNQDLVLDGAIVNKLYDNYYLPDKSIINHFYEIPYEINSIELIPIQFQEFEGKKRFANCGNAKVIGNIECIFPECTVNAQCTNEKICVNHLCVSCGNGIIEVGEGEQCDDQNRENGDGCTSSCLQETGWICAGQPSICNQ